uniref:FYVE-type domain-containing protein n=1 Tax=Globisporangium ultimum (strain ATCC 200006 / CBS 805.95 / DAOM BR144) TaxID=431595 RepID=K3WQX4_GLOUD
MFARNEEWCFLESYNRSPSGESFCLIQSTTSASEIEVGRASHARVDQLCGITTSILVEKIPGTRSVRVFFHGEYRTHLNGGTKGIVSLKATKARLMMLAKTVSRIPEIVHRRRLGIQKLASRSVFAVKNTRCLCCTKGLHFLAKKKRCYMCGYFVCDKCWSQQVMETHNSKITAVVVCTRCVDNASAREYSKVRYSERLSERVPTSRRHCDFKSADTPGKALVDLLENAALDDSDELFQEATISVIKDILTQDKEASLSYVKPTPDYSSRDSHTDPVQALERRFDHIASRRMSVPLKPSSSMPEFRAPTQQGESLNMNSDCKFLNLGEVTELNILCALATNELKCAMSQITIVDQDSELIVASNVMKPRHARVARSHAFCSHVIMDGNPLVLHDPEVNEHLCHLDAVTKQDIRFFCGFPIIAEDGTVVGSLCCLDFRDFELTQTQYSMMTKLAKTASNVIQAKRSAVVAQPLSQ